MRRYTPPPEPVYNAGKKKANATNLLKLIETVRNDTGNAFVRDELARALVVVKSYRKSLDEL